MSGKDDGSSGHPRQVRRKPGGWYIAVRINDPAAWLVVAASTGRTHLVKISEGRAAQIYDWPLI